MHIKRPGVTVKDANRDLKIRIKPEDIKHAVCRDHQKCVVALAIKRQLEADWVDVGANRVIIGVSKTRAHRFILNNLAREQVRYFDENKGSFAPCRVQLYAPPDSKKLGYRAAPHPKHWKRRAKRTNKRAQPTR